MSYEPLALKYRPRRFADLVGQETVATTLRNAVKSGRLANAFLFCGSRGTGKTSTARIFAKALQCPNSSEGEPCAECDICKAIASGDDIDVIEIDGASNRGIDEIRQIRDNAGYAPARARFKLYIIDEVHMLTIQAFNALLKTLEEPPSHVKFLFATTEASAVPETITSRCQRFDFMRIPAPAIVARLQYICTQENLSAEPAALQMLAAKCEGGLRDALSLLEQSVAYGGESITADGVARALGLSGREICAAIVQPLIAGDAGGLLHGLDRALERGRDAEELLDDLVEILRAAMVASATEADQAVGAQAELATALLQAWPLQRLMLAMRLLLNARRESRLAGMARIQLELALLKVLHSSALLSLDEMRALLGGAPPSGAPAGAAPARTFERRAPPAPIAPPAPPRAQIPAPTPVAAPTPAPPPVAAPAAMVQAGALTLEALQAGWPKFLSLLGDQKKRLAGHLEGSEVVSLQQGTLLIRLRSDFARKNLEEKAQREVLGESFVNVFGTVVALRFETGAAQQSNNATQQAPDRDPGAMKLISAFDGTVVHKSENGPQAKE